MSKDEQAIEAEIQAKGLNAPRLSPEKIDAVIAGEDYHVFPGTTLTVCCLKLHNGFTVTGESAAASPENFDVELGRKIARSNARAPVMSDVMRRNSRPENLLKNVLDNTRNVNHHLSMNTIDMVRAARERNPQAPAADIARDLGVSRERVRQALVELGYPTRVARTRARNPLRYSVPMPPHTVGAVCELQVGFVAFMRSGGNLVDAGGAVKYYQNSAT